MTHEQFDELFDYLKEEVYNYLSGNYTKEDDDGEGRSFEYTYVSLNDRCKIQLLINLLQKCKDKTTPYDDLYNVNLEEELKRIDKKYSLF